MIHVKARHKVMFVVEALPLGGCCRKRTVCYTTRLQKASDNHPRSPPAVRRSFSPLALSRSRNRRGFLGGRSRRFIAQGSLAKCTTPLVFRRCKPRWRCTIVFSSTSRHLTDFTPFLIPEKRTAGFREANKSATRQTTPWPR